MYDIILSFPVSTIQKPHGIVIQQLSLIAGEDFTPHVAIRYGADAFV